MALVLNATLLAAADGSDYHYEEGTALPPPAMEGASDMTRREELEMGVQEMLDQWRYHVRELAFRGKKDLHIWPRKKVAMGDTCRKLHIVPLHRQGKDNN